MSRAGGESMVPSAPDRGELAPGPDAGQTSPAAASRHGSAAHTAAAISVFVLLLALALRQVGSPDVGFHLNVGRSILAGDGWPTTDRLTYTLAEHAYVDTSWGYQTLVALTHSLAGAPGLEIFPSGANFVLVRPPAADGEDAVAAGLRVWNALLEHGVLVRNFAAWPRTPGCLRITVGTREEDDAFLAALEEVLGHG